MICGPTASGKTGLAIALAQRFDAVILSADSRQVYREFDIGTAKPTIAEQQGIPHYLIDICEPTETLTVAEYQTQAQALIAQFQTETQNEGSSIARSLLLVGGTGLYIRAITKGLKIPQVPPQTDLRSQLQTLGQAQCYTMLQQVDPTAAAKIHPNDQVRTLRSLEVFTSLENRCRSSRANSRPITQFCRLGWTRGMQKHSSDGLSSALSRW